MTFIQTILVFIAAVIVLAAFIAGATLVKEYPAIIGLLFLFFKLFKSIWKYNHP